MRRSHHDPELAAAWVDDIGRDYTDVEIPVEVRRPGRTITRSKDQIVAWHHSHVTNGPTEAINSLVKRVASASNDSSTTGRHRVGQTARRRPENAKHAVRSTVRVHETTGYSIFVGPSRSGALLEVGASVSTEQVLVIFHAMPARRKFL